MPQGEYTKELAALGLDSLALQLQAAGDGGRAVARLSRSPLTIEGVTEKEAKHDLWSDVEHLSIDVGTPSPLHNRRARARVQAPRKVKAEASFMIGAHGSLVPTMPTSRLDQRSHSEAGDGGALLGATSHGFHDSEASVLQSLGDLDSRLEQLSHARNARRRER